MSFTVIVYPRSALLTMRFAISSGVIPSKFHITLMTGILMFGKMSTGVRRMVMGVRIMISNAITTNV